MNKLTEAQVIEVSIAFAIALVGGWLIKNFIIPVLFKLASKTKWKSDDLILDTIGRWVVFWFVLAAGMYVLPIFSSGFKFVARNQLTIKHIIGGLFIFSLTWVTARISVGLLVIRSSFNDSVLPSTSILGNIIKALIYVVGFILILNTFGVAIAPMVTALGVGGIAVALALQPTLSNLFSGLQIIASGKVNIGDLVQLESGQRGVITDITWRNTVIKTAQNNLIIMPNSKMSDSIVENFFLADKEVTFSVTIGVSYDSDLQQVEKVALEVANQLLQQQDGAAKNFEPFVRFFNFGESSIDLKVFLGAKEYGEQFLITSLFIMAIHKRFGEEGISIPFPIRTLYIKKEEQRPVANPGQQMASPIIAGSTTSP